MEIVLLLSNLAATLVMVGIIWFVQIVHYPLFGRVGTAGFPAYSAAHSRLTGLVVGPPMLVEAVTAVLLLFVRPAVVPAAGVWGGVFLLAGVWLSTALLQAPRHRVLGLDFDVSAHRFLVLSNWLRTVLWSARGLLVLWMVARVMA
ncbi:MAG: hypothetical protein ACR2HO_10845 [Rubrobacteraceae bacterium]|nr:hypothetical protein [Rubrobacter sp.]